MVVVKMLQLYYITTQPNAEQLRQAISKYLNIEALTPYILNKLIAKIEIGSVEVVNSEKKQEVRIVWRFSIII